MIRATVTYSCLHEDTCKETIEVEVAVDSPYSPDLVDDLAARARATLRATYTDMWPEPEVATP